MDEYFLIGAKRGARRLISQWRMRRRDGRPVPRAPEEIRLFLVVRNEMLRLPYFFKYYRELGVDRFFVVDNASTDQTLDFLLGQSDTHVFATRETYVRQEAWVDSLLRRYGVGHWCVVIDVDELLLYPHMDALSLRNFCRFLDEGNAEAVHCLLLDMYPDKPLSRSAYASGDPFLPAAPWFDPASHRTQKFQYHNCRTGFPFRFCGGVRERLFGLQGICCSKFPLLKFHRGLFLRQGTHAVEGAVIAEEIGVILHFKYLNDFGPRVLYEAVRGEHWNQAVQYKAYAQKIEQDPDLSFYDSRSVKYENPGQLLALGLMKDSEALLQHVLARRQDKIPPWSEKQ